MRRPQVTGRIFGKSNYGLMATGFIAALLTTTSLVACGGRFTASSKLGAPPITADPLAAENEQKRLALANGESEISYFKSGRDEKAFNEAMDSGNLDFDKYAADVETHPDDKESKEVPAFDENPVAADDEANGPSAGGPAQTDPDNKSVVEMPKADSKPESKTELKPESKTDVAAGKEKPAHTVQQVKRPALAIPTFAKDICARTNIKSATPENFDALYSDSEALPKVLPSVELSKMESRQKQNQFICKLLPHALRMNAEVFSQRLYLARLQYRAQKGILKDDDKQWIAQMKVAYRLKDSATNEDLMKRVDIVPLPMLLAQAAIESGWGTSRATKEANNLFGIHARPGQKCLPGFDSEGKACILIFDSITASVSYYIRSLNRVAAYEAFRSTRLEQRKAGQSLDSEKLLPTLLGYSERGAEYTVAVQQIMSGHNNLNKYQLSEKKMADAAREPK